MASLYRQIPWIMKGSQKRCRSNLYVFSWGSSTLNRKIACFLIKRIYKWEIPSNSGKDIITSALFHQAISKSEQLPESNSESISSNSKEATKLLSSMGKMKD
jgi:hypothetical protein